MLGKMLYTYLVHYLTNSFGLVHHKSHSVTMFCG